MAVSQSDIVYQLSGGSSNSNPDLSIGGPPSSVPISGIENNLFRNITPEQNTSGLVDYRCFYIFNNNGIDSLFNTSLYIASQTLGGSVISVGVREATDVQQVTINGTVSGGTLTLAYEGDSTVIDYDSDITVFNENVQNGLNSDTSLSGVISEFSAGSGSITFTLLFEGEDDKRYHDLVTLVSNDLTGTPSISITKVTDGSPVNATANQLDTDLVEPNDVTFLTYSSSNPIEIGKLNSLDGIPIWVRRVTAAGVEPIEKDGFRFAVYGSLLQ